MFNFINYLRRKTEVIDHDFLGWKEFIEREMLAAERVTDSHVKIDDQGNTFYELRIAGAIQNEFEAQGAKVDFDDILYWIQTANHRRDFVSTLVDLCTEYQEHLISA